MRLRTCGWAGRRRASEAESRETDRRVAPPLPSARHPPAVTTLIDLWTIPLCKHLALTLWLAYYCTHLEYRYIPASAGTVLISSCKFLALGCFYFPGTCQYAGSEHYAAAGRLSIFPTSTTRIHFHNCGISVSWSSVSGTVLSECSQRCPSFSPNRCRICPKVSTVEYWYCHSRSTRRSRSAQKVTSSFPYWQLSSTYGCHTPWYWLRSRSTNN